MLEAVLERRFWTGGTLVLTARRYALRDVVDTAPLFTPGGVIGIVSNIGEGRQTDLAASLTAPLKPLGLNGVMLKGGVTWIHSRATDPTTGQRRRLSGQSAVVADAHLSHDLPRWKLTWASTRPISAPAPCSGRTDRTASGARAGPMCSSSTGPARP